MYDTVRNLAIDWQDWASGQDLSYGELAEWAGAIETMATLADDTGELLEELKEICKKMNMLQMKNYHVTLVIRDCTSVDAASEAEAKQIAIDIFKENGYDMDRGYELEIEEGDDV